MGGRRPRASAEAGVLLNRQRCNLFAQIQVASSMTRSAKTEKANLVVNHLEPVRLLHATAEAGQCVLRDWATRQLLDPPAALADQVGVMAGELLTQLIPKHPTACFHGPQEPGRHQEVDGPVDGDAVDPLLGDSAL